MSANQTNNDSGSQNNDTNNNGTGTYSADYVKTLRDENASWRTKLRELEVKHAELENKIKVDTVANTIGKELEKRGVKADPSWVKVSEGMTTEQAVDKFLKDYPHLVPKEEITTSPKKQNINPMRPNSHDTNIENTAKSELGAIKHDPIARSKVRDLYRGLLAQNSGIPNYIK